MLRQACAAVAVAGMVCGASGAEWFLHNRKVIHPSGVYPSVRGGSVVFTVGIGGALWRFDGTESAWVYGSAGACHEPENPGSERAAWRNLQGARNDIYLWDGETARNLSDSPAADTSLSSGSNGDLIWSHSHTWLMYYDASEDAVIPLGVKGDYPSLYVGEDGVTTYAYQDPETREVRYFDGSETHVLGDGAATGAFPSVWNGAVAWLADRTGGMFKTGEVFYWKNGETVRVTNDDAVDGIADEGAVLWRDIIIWTRSPNGPLQPRLYLWAGGEIVEVSSTGGRVPSFESGRASWVDSDGLNVASVHLRGDLNCDNIVDYGDIDAFVAALNGEVPYETAHPGCTRINADCNCDGVVNYADIDPFVQLLSTGHSQCP